MVVENKFREVTCQIVEGLEGRRLLLHERWAAIVGFWAKEQHYLIYI